METDIVKRLRNKEGIKLFDSSTKTFIRIQLNKETKRIYWERWVSIDKSNWVCHNKFLSLKEIVFLINENKLKNQKP